MSQSNEENYQIWNRPMKPAHEILAELEKELANPPEEIELNIKLTGLGAKKYFFISRLLEVGFEEAPEEIAKYLVRVGVEQEIIKIAAAASQISKEDLTQKT